GAAQRGRPRCADCNNQIAVVDELGLQSAEETLHWRIVPADSLAAHRLDDSGGLQDVAVVAGGVLAAAVGMMDQACSRALRWIAMVSANRLARFNRRRRGRSRQ